MEPKIASVKEVMECVQASRILRDTIYATGNTGKLFSLLLELHKLDNYLVRKSVK